MTNNKQQTEHRFCVTPELKCTMSYCDENGCINRQRHLVGDPIEMKNNKQQNPIDWLSNQFYELFEQYSEGNFDRITFNELMLALTYKAREMYQDKMEAAIIKQCAEQSTSDASKYAEGYKEGYKRALDYMTDTIKNKIEIKENANNEFRKGTANTTHTTFLCTEFVSDQLFYKGTLPHCMRCGKPQYHHPIISNTI
jgi:hypothetical protein